MKIHILLLGFSLLPYFLLAQQSPKTYTLQGYVLDQTSGEKLIGATIYLPQAKVGVLTNRYGYFSISTTAASPITVSYVGYTSQTLSVPFGHDTLLTLSLAPLVAELTEVTVRQTTGKDDYQQAVMGRFVLPLDLVKKAPALLGENDLLKTLQFLPGVQAGTEGTVGLNVRGGSPDQNLVLLDGMTLYNLNHLFGFFSVINTDAVAQAEFLKGSIPAQYGGRLSSVLDIALREGNLRQWKGNFSVSPIAGRMTLEGPLKKEVSSLLISVRRTWLDALYRLAANRGNNSSKNGYGFYDINAKMNYKLSNKDRLYLSFYGGNDKYSSRLSMGSGLNRYGFAWGNQTLGLRWNHVYGKRLFGNTTVSYSRFQYRLNQEYRNEASGYFNTNQISSGIVDLAFKSDLDYYASPHHLIRGGVGFTRHLFKPEIRQFTSNEPNTAVPVNGATAVPTGELTAYAQDDWLVNDRWRAQAGLHYANQMVQGKVWQSLQPRLSVRYQVGPQAALKAAYNRMTQFLHLLTNSSVGLPTDLWVPVTDRIPPAQAQWFSVGYSQTVRKAWEVSLETYYKWLHNVLDYREGGSFLNSFSTPWYERVSIGQGTVYGAEFYVEKKVGATRGWGSYTLSWTNRQFDDINGGRVFPYKYDRRHNLALVISHDLTKYKSLSANFTYSSGTALTLAQSAYQGLPLPQTDLDPHSDPHPSFFDHLPELQQRNNFRTPAYHRLDVSYRTTKVKSHGQRTWIISCYNIYNRQNPFFLYYDKTQLKQLSLFPIIPSLSYQYEF